MTRRVTLKRLSIQWTSFPTDDQESGSMAGAESVANSRETRATKSARARYARCQRLWHGNKSHVATPVAVQAERKEQRRRMLFRNSRQSAVYEHRDARVIYARGLRAVAKSTFRDSTRLIVAILDKGSISCTHCR